MSTKTEMLSNNEGYERFKRRLKLLKNGLTMNTKQFCKKASLNGLKFLTNEELYTRERFFFGIAFVTAALFAGYFILRVWDKWSTTPVIFGTNPNASYITEEPFPAITICNLNVAYKRKAEQFSIYSTEYAMLQMLCKRDVNVSIADSITDWSNLVDFLTEIAQPCSNMLANCRFGAVSYNCSELFMPIITDEGLCCTFNMLHPAFIFNSKNYDNTSVEQDMGDFKPVKWSSETGYEVDLPKKYYPRKAVGSGETLGLSVTLDVEADEYYCSSLNSKGFKIVVHNPIESPSMREIGVLLAPGTETKIRLRPEKYEAEQKLRNIDREYRQCIFQGEKKLEIYREYSHGHCEVECLVKLMLKNCGCITYYMPVLYGNESICSIYELTCVERVRIASMVLDYNVTGCEGKCLPSCYEINYFQSFFWAPLKHYGFQIANQVVKNMSNAYVEQNIVVLHMFHMEYTYRSFKQTEFFGATDALSSMGGLMSLFLGFSFIFLAESIFFTMIKPFRKSRHSMPASENIGFAKTSNPSWKIPVRKRYRHGAGYSYKRNLYDQKQFGSKAFKLNWHSKRHFIIGADNGY